MGKRYSPWDRFYQKINMIFNGVAASSMIPFAIVFLQIRNGEVSPLINDDSGIVKILLIILSLAILVVSNLSSPKLIAPVRKEPTIDKKVRLYLIQKIKQYAIVESSAIVALIGFFLLKQQIFSFIYVGILFLFSMYRPTFSRVAKEIGESEEDIVKWSLNDNIEG
ncbi:MAG: hypothetical protein JXR03_09940 [Cyclobacteriaceae bacterium]